MNREEIIFFIEVILGLLLIGILLSVIILSNISERECRTECKTQGATDYKWEAGGGLSKDNDICICILKAKIFRMGELG